MTYYHYEPDADHYDGIGLSAQDHDVIEMHWRSAALGSTWSPVVVHGFDDNPGVESDFPSLSDYNKIPVFSERALKALRPLIGYCSEALPVQHPSGTPFYIINVMEIIDCIDHDRSSMKRYSDGGVMRVMAYCMRDDMLSGKHIFKTPKVSGADLIVDEAFREVVESNDLKGLIFKDLPLVQ